MLRTINVDYMNEAVGRNAQDNIYIQFESQTLFNLCTNYHIIGLLHTTKQNTVDSRLDLALKKKISQTFEFKLHVLI